MRRLLRILLAAEYLVSTLHIGLPHAGAREIMFGDKYRRLAAYGRHLNSYSHQTHKVQPRARTATSVAEPSSLAKAALDARGRIFAILAGSPDFNYVRHDDGRIVRYRDGRVDSVANEKVPDAQGNLSTRNTFDMRYDGSGRLLAYNTDVTDPLGNLTRVSWHGAEYRSGRGGKPLLSGYVQDTLDPFGNRTRIERSDMDYDRDGLLLRYRETETDARGNRAQRDWQALRYGAEQRIAEFEETERDALGNVRKRRWMDGTYAKNPSQRPEGREKEYLLTGYRESVDEAGIQTRRRWGNAAYDDLGRILSYEEETEEALGRVSRTLWSEAAYDSYGRLLRYRRKTTDSAGTVKETLWEAEGYSHRNRLTGYMETSSAASGPGSVLKRTDMRYSTEGELAFYRESQSDGNGSVAFRDWQAQAFDARGLPLAYSEIATDHAGAQSKNLRTDIRWDHQGRPLQYKEQTTDPHQIRTERRWLGSYDRYGRLSEFREEQRSAEDQASHKHWRAETYDAADRITGYSQTLTDADGNVTRGQWAAGGVKDPGGYDAQGRLKSFRESLTDAYGQTSVRTWSNAAYDTDGNLRSFNEAWTDPTGVETLRVWEDAKYDPRGRLIGHRETWAHRAPMEERAVQDYSREWRALSLDRFGRVLHSMEEYFDPQGLRIRRGEESDIVYDPSSRKISYLLESTGTDGVLFRTFRLHTDYDAQGRISGYAETTRNDLEPLLRQDLFVANRGYDRAGRAIQGEEAVILKGLSLSGRNVEVRSERTIRDAVLRDGYALSYLQRTATRGNGPAGESLNFAEEIRTSDISPSSEVATFRRTGNGLDHTIVTRRDGIVRNHQGQAVKYQESITDKAKPESKNRIQRLETFYGARGEVLGWTETIGGPDGSMSDKQVRSLGYDGVGQTVSYEQTVATLQARERTRRLSTSYDGLGRVTSSVEETASDAESASRTEEWAALAFDAAGRVAETWTRATNRSAAHRQPYVTSVHRSRIEYDSAERISSYGDLEVDSRTPGVVTRKSASSISYDTSGRRSAFTEIGAQEDEIGASLRRLGGILLTKRNELDGEMASQWAAFIRSGEDLIARVSRWIGARAAGLSRSEIAHFSGLLTGLKEAVIGEGRDLHDFLLSWRDGTPDREALASRLLVSVYAAFPVQALRLLPAGIAGAQTAYARMHPFDYGATVSKRVATAYDDSGRPDRWKELTFSLSSGELLSESETAVSYEGDSRRLATYSARVREGEKVSQIFKFDHVHDDGGRALAYREISFEGNDIEVDGMPLDWNALSPQQKRSLARDLLSGRKEARGAVTIQSYMNMEYDETDRLASYDREIHERGTRFQTVGELADVHEALRALRDQISLQAGEKARLSEALAARQAGWDIAYTEAQRDFGPVLPSVGNTEAVLEAVADIASSRHEAASAAKADWLRTDQARVTAEKVLSASEAMVKEAISQVAGIQAEIGRAMDRWSRLDTAFQKSERSLADMLAALSALAGGGGLGAQAIGAMIKKWSILERAMHFGRPQLAASKSLVAAWTLDREFSTKDHEFLKTWSPDKALDAALKLAAEFDAASAEIAADSRTLIELTETASQELEGQLQSDRRESAAAQAALEGMREVWTVRKAALDSMAGQRDDLENERRSAVSRAQEAAARLERLGRELDGISAETARYREQGTLASLGSTDQKISGEWEVNAGLYWKASLAVDETVVEHNLGPNFFDSRTHGRRLSLGELAAELRAIRGYFGLKDAFRGSPLGSSLQRIEAMQRLLRQRDRIVAQLESAQNEAALLRIEADAFSEKIGDFDERMGPAQLEHDAALAAMDSGLEAAARARSREEESGSRAQSAQEAARLAKHVHDRMASIRTDFNAMAYGALEAAAAALPAAVTGLKEKSVDWRAAWEEADRAKKAAARSLSEYQHKDSARRMAAERAGRMLDAWAAVQEGTQELEGSERLTMISREELEVLQQAARKILSGPLWMDGAPLRILPVDIDALAEGNRARLRGRDWSLADLTNGSSLRSKIVLNQDSTVSRRSMTYGARGLLEHYKEIQMKGGEIVIGGERRAWSDLDAKVKDAVLNAEVAVAAAGIPGTESRLSVTRQSRTAYNSIGQAREQSQDVFESTVYKHTQTSWNGKTRISGMTYDDLGRLAGYSKSTQTDDRAWEESTLSAIKYDAMGRKIESDVRIRETAPGFDRTSRVLTAGIRYNDFGQPVAQRKTTWDGRQATLEISREDSQVDAEGRETRSHVARVETASAGRPNDETAETAAGRVSEIRLQNLDFGAAGRPTRMRRTVSDRGRWTVEDIEQDLDDRGRAVASRSRIVEMGGPGENHFKSSRIDREVIATNEAGLSARTRVAYQDRFADRSAIEESLEDTGYDTSGRLLSSRTRTTESAPGWTRTADIELVVHAYDDRNRVARQTRTTVAGALRTVESNRDTRDFAYDSSGRNTRKLTWVTEEAAGDEAPAFLRSFLLEEEFGSFDRWDRPSSLARVVERSRSGEVFRDREDATHTYHPDGRIKETVSVRSSSLIDALGAPRTVPDTTSVALARADPRSPDTLSVQFQGATLSLPRGELTWQELTEEEKGALISGRLRSSPGQALVVRRLQPRALDAGGQALSWIEDVRIFDGERNSRIANVRLHTEYDRLNRPIASEELSVEGPALMLGGKLRPLDTVDLQAWRRAWSNLGRDSEADPLTARWIPNHFVTYSGTRGMRYSAEGDLVSWTSERREVLLGDGVPDQSGRVPLAANRWTASEREETVTDVSGQVLASLEKTSSSSAPDTAVWSFHDYDAAGRPKETLRLTQAAEEKDWDAEISVTEESIPIGGRDVATRSRVTHWRGVRPSDALTHSAGLEGFLSLYGKMDSFAVSDRTIRSGETLELDYEPGPALARAARTLRSQESPFEPNVIEETFLYYSGLDPKPDRTRTLRAINPEGKAALQGLERWEEESTLEYDPRGQLWRSSTSRRDPDGRRTFESAEFSYDPASKRTARSQKSVRAEPTGPTTVETAAYEYDDRRVARTRVLRLEADGTSVLEITSFAYDPVTGRISTLERAAVDGARSLEDLAPPGPYRTFTKRSQIEYHGAGRFQGMESQYVQTTGSSDAPEKLVEERCYDLAYDASGRQINMQSEVRELRISGGDIELLRAYRTHIQYGREEGGRTLSGYDGNGRAVFFERKSEEAGKVTREQVSQSYGPDGKVSSIRRHIGESGGPLDHSYVQTAYFFYAPGAAVPGKQVTVTEEPPRETVEESVLEQDQQRRVLRKRSTLTAVAGMAGDLLAHSVITKTFQDYDGLGRPTRYKTEIRSGDKTVIETAGGLRYAGNGSLVHQDSLFEEQAGPARRVWSVTMDQDYGAFGLVAKTSRRTRENGKETIEAAQNMSYDANGRVRVVETDSQERDVQTGGEAYLRRLHVRQENEYNGLGQVSSYRRISQEGLKTVTETARRVAYDGRERPVFNDSEFREFVPGRLDVSYRTSTESAYDEGGRVSSYRRLRWEGDKETEETAWDMVYDEYGGLRSTQVTIEERDSARIALQRMTRVKTTFQSYDALGRAEATDKTIFSGQKATRESWSGIRYDRSGNLAAAVLELDESGPGLKARSQVQIRNEYSSIGQLTGYRRDIRDEEKLVEETAELLRYGLDGTLTQSSIRYDETDLRTGGKEHKKSYKVEQGGMGYNPLGQLVSYTRTTRDDRGWAMTEKTMERQSYDLQGRLAASKLRVHQFGPAATGALNNFYTLETKGMGYNSLGQWIAYERTLEDGEKLSRESTLAPLRYDEKGRRTGSLIEFREEDREGGGRLNRSWTALHRVGEMDGLGRPAATETWTLEGARLTRELRRNQVYDPDGRVLHYSQTTFQGDKVRSEKTLESVAYDALGRPVRWRLDVLETGPGLRLESERETKHGKFDSAGRLLRYMETTTEKRSGRMGKAHQEETSQDIRYNGLGQATVIALDFEETMDGAPPEGALRRQWSARTEITRFHADGLAARTKRVTREGGLESEERSLSDLRYDSQARVVYSRNKVTESGDGLLHSYDVTRSAMIYNSLDQVLRCTQTVSRYEKTTTEAALQDIAYDSEGRMTGSLHRIFEESDELSLNRSFRQRVVVLNYNGLGQATGRRIERDEDTAAPGARLVALESGIAYDAQGRMDSYRQVWINSSAAETAVVIERRGTLYDPLGRESEKHEVASQAWVGAGGQVVDLAEIRDYGVLDAQALAAEAPATGFGAALKRIWTESGPGKGSDLARGLFHRVHQALLRRGLSDATAGRLAAQAVNELPARFSLGDVPDLFARFFSDLAARMSVETWTTDLRSDSLGRATSRKERVRWRETGGGQIPGLDPLWKNAEAESEIAIAYQGESERPLSISRQVRGGGEHPDPDVRLAGIDFRQAKFEVAYDRRGREVSFQSATTQYQRYSYSWIEKGFLTREVRRVENQLGRITTHSRHKVEAFDAYGRAAETWVWSLRDDGNRTNVVERTWDIAYRADGLRSSSRSQSWTAVSRPQDMPFPVPGASGSENREEFKTETSVRYEYDLYGNMDRDATQRKTLTASELLRNDGPGTTAAGEAAAIAITAAKVAVMIFLPQLGPAAIAAHGGLTLLDAAIWQKPLPQAVSEAGLQAAADVATLGMSRWAALAGLSGWKTFGAHALGKAVGASLFAAFSGQSAERTLLQAGAVILLSAEASWISPALKTRLGEAGTAALLRAALAGSAHAGAAALQGVRGREVLTVATVAAAVAFVSRPWSGWNEAEPAAGEAVTWRNAGAVLIAAGVAVALGARLQGLGLPNQVLLAAILNTGLRVVGESRHFQSPQAPAALSSALRAFSTGLSAGLETGRTLQRILLNIVSRLSIMELKVERKTTAPAAGSIRTESLAAIRAGMNALFRMKNYLNLQQRRILGRMVEYVGAEMATNRRKMDQVRAERANLEVQAARMEYAMLRDRDLSAHAERTVKELLQQGYVAILRDRLAKLAGLEKAIRSSLAQGNGGRAGRLILDFVAQNQGYDQMYHRSLDLIDERRRLAEILIDSGDRRTWMASRGADGQKLERVRALQAWDAKALSGLRKEESSAADPMAHRLVSETFASRTAGYPSQFRVAAGEDFKASQSYALYTMTKAVLVSFSMQAAASTSEWSKAALKSVRLKETLDTIYKAGSDGGEHALQFSVQMLSWGLERLPPSIPAWAGRLAAALARGIRNADFNIPGTPLGMPPSSTGGAPIAKISSPGLDGWVRVWQAVLKLQPFYIELGGLYAKSGWMEILLLCGGR